MKFTFKIGAKIKEAWPLYKKSFWMFLLFLIVVFMLSSIGNSIATKILSSGNILAYCLFIIVYFVFNIFVSFVLLRSIINLIDGKGFKPFSKESIPNPNAFLNFILVSILIAIPVFCITGILVILAKLKIVNGFILVLIGFISIIYLITRLIFATYLVVDKNQDAVSSIKESWKITKDNVWNIFGKMIVIGLFMLAGFLALFVGSIITYPVGMMVIVMMYREFTKWRQVNPVSIPPSVVSQ